jgi:hypothetical protein
VASDVRKRKEKKTKQQKHAKYLTGISSNAVFIHTLVNTPTKVKIFPGSEVVKGKDKQAITVLTKTAQIAADEINYNNGNVSLFLRLHLNPRQFNIIKTL